MPHTTTAVRPSCRTRVVSTLLAIAAGLVESPPAQAQCVVGGSNPTAAFNDFWGAAVAISADGTTAVAGGPRFSHSPTAFGRGAVRILVRSGQAWQLQSFVDAFNLPLGPSNSAAFGSSLDISADGNTVIVGAPSDSVSLRVGSARILVRNPATGIWSQQARLLDPTPDNDGLFGAAVSISDDGNTAIVGQPGYSFTSITPGAYVFTRIGTTWSAATSLPASPAPLAIDGYGFSVAMSPDGLLAAVGAPARVNSPTSHGSVHIFKKTAGVWSQETVLSRNVTFVGYFPNEVERFGHALALDGTLAGSATLAIGDPHNSELVPTGQTDHATYSGCVLRYTRAGGTWSLDKQIFAPEVQYPVEPFSIDTTDQFGNAVALRGSHMIVGAWGDEECSNGGGIDNNGSVYRFEGDSMMQRVLHPENFTNDTFGTSVDIADDGNTFIAGAPGGDEPTLDFTGTAEVFDGTTTTQLIGVDPATSAFDITITFPGGDPGPQTFTVHLTGRLYAISGADCGANPTSVAVQDYDNLATVENAFTIALPGGQSATFGQFQLNTQTVGHAATLNSSGAGYLHGYQLGASTTLITPPAFGSSGCPLGCSMGSSICVCDAVTAFFDFCLAILTTDPHPVDGAGSNLTIRDLDVTTVMNLGMGANNPVIHITGGINVPLPCPGNVNGDQSVNVADLLAVISNWGPCGDCGLCPADIAPAKPDCNVNVADLLAVISHWGACP